MSSPPMADSKAGRTVPRWKFRPGPATSANAPRACALKALSKQKVRFSTNTDQTFIQTLKEI